MKGTTIEINGRGYIERERVGLNEWELIDAGVPIAWTVGGVVLSNHPDRVEDVKKWAASMGCTPYIRA